MPKTKRLSINLSLENYQVLSEISDKSGASKSSFLNQMLSESAPALIKLSKALDQAKNKNLETFDTLTEALNLVVLGAEQASLDMGKTKNHVLTRKG